MNDYGRNADAVTPWHRVNIRDVTGIHKELVPKTVTFEIYIYRHFDISTTFTN